jgi:hypothetical protein
MEAVTERIKPRDGERQCPPAESSPLRLLAFIRARVNLFGPAFPCRLHPREREKQGGKPVRSPLLQGRKKHGMFCSCRA